MTVTIGLGEPGVVTMTPMPLSLPGNQVSANVPLPANVSQGIANRITPSFEFQSTETPAATKSPPAGKKVNQEAIFPAKVPNVLENFASCTALWTLACISPSQFNDPASYRNSPADFKKFVVFSSAGRFDKQRVNTYNGTPEYYVDNFVMTSKIAPDQQVGNTNIINLSFEVYEPYSMGVLLESLQNAAIKAGYENYIGCPFSLRLDFQGFDEDGTSLSIIKPKFFTIHLKTVKFKVTESGSQYKVTAIPYNDIGYSSVYNTTFRDLQLHAGSEGTVAEVLKTGKDSLVAALNNLEQSLLKEKRIGVVDVYDIQFPPESSAFTSLAGGTESSGNSDGGSATSNPKSVLNSVTVDKKAKEFNDPLMNGIGKAKFNFNQSSGGTVPMTPTGEGYDEKTGVVDTSKLIIDAKTRSFQFPAEQRLTDIITKIILSSDYTKNSNDPKNKVNGMIKHFMIDIQVELLDLDPLIGDYAKKFTFRVRPYMVHSIINTNPKSEPESMDYVKSKVAKVYNYIYTGKNTDVLKFDIEINNLFFIGANPSPEKDTAKGGANPDQSGVAEDSFKKSNMQLGSSQGESTQLRPRIKRDISLMDEASGGSGLATTEYQIAKQFQEAFLSGSSADIINAKIEILGDPYWLVDHGFSNYFSSRSDATEQMTKDNTANYQDGEIYMYLSFRSPIDLREDLGIYQFSTDSVGKEHPYSGIYRVTECQSTFKGGTFIQRISGVRVSFVDEKDPSKLKPVEDTSSIMEITGDAKPSSTMNQGLWHNPTPPATDYTPSTPDAKTQELINSYKPGKDRELAALTHDQNYIDLLRNTGDYSPVPGDVNPQ
jgi:hypothetical protein